MTSTVEANADGLVGPTHNFAGLSPGNLASAANAGAVSNPRAAVLEGLEKMARVAALGLPQFVLPPHDRPDMAFLRALGFGGSDGEVLARAHRDAPEFLGASASASSMWAANAATVTPSADAADGRVHLSAANLLTNLHRGLEPAQTARVLRRLMPDEARFAVHDALPRAPHFGDEGAANHVRLKGEGGSGVNLFVYGRDAYEPWTAVHPARQTRQASEAIARRHGTARAVFARQSRRAIECGAFHNDVVCVGAGTCLFFHEAAFEDAAAVRGGIAAAAQGLFTPEFVEVSEAELPLTEAVRSYLFNSMLVRPPGADRLTLVAPSDVAQTSAAKAVVDRLLASNGPIGAVHYVDVRQSMRNGGGPACLRLRIELTEDELAAVNPAQRFDAALHARLADWATRRYRDRLAPADLADPSLLEESRTALTELAGILALGSDLWRLATSQSTQDVGSDACIHQDRSTES